MKFLEVKQNTKNKFVNMFTAKYVRDCSTSNYIFASRRQKQDLSILNQKDMIDAVKVLPYFQEDGKIFVVFIKEFRCVVNRYIYGFVAGLVEKNEEPKVSAQREIYEEIGGQTLNIEQIDNGVYSSVGMSDEKIMHFIAEVRLAGKQHLEESEDISLQIVPLDEMLAFVESHEFDGGSLMLAKMFYYKVKNQQ